MDGNLPRVAELLPHAPPMVLLDEAVCCDGDDMTCAVTIREDTPFVDEGGADPLVCFEHMLQCIGAWVGARVYAGDEPVQIGFVIACRQMDLHVERVPLGTRLTVRSRRVWGDMALGQFDCSTHAGERPVATARFSVYRGDLPPEAVA